MSLTRLYFHCKPFIPRRLRFAIRRSRARRILERSSNVWPIKESAAKSPVNWDGWPGGKQFAFVLTHDVESQVGLDRVKPLAELEMKLGFRSSFNLIPEGEYKVPEELRNWLVQNHFEIGVHDLRHDGHLYESHRVFQKNAERINGYLAQWGAAGFRSGFMLNRLEWLHDLNIQYDASTFDTDPFEPQPQGADTIFPYIITRNDGHTPSSYVELPYTLPQDSTLFLQLEEQTPRIWLEKLNWVASHGGMALINVHPDYIAMNGDCAPLEYPLAHYEKLLVHLKESYRDTYWHPLPREVATFINEAGNKGTSPVNTPADSILPGRSTTSPPSAHRDSIHVTGRPKIWIDLDNTPHVPFFEPILDELATRGYPLLVTARNAFQVAELADKKGLKHHKIGRHYGKNRLAKGAGLIFRSMQLAPTVLREKPAIAVSHGARSQLILGKWLGIQTLLLEDYEYCQFPAIMSPSWIMTPDAFEGLDVAQSKQHVGHYPGLKEDVYAWRLKPDRGLLDELGLSEDDIVVTVRPPATEAHYYNPESLELFESFMQLACDSPGVRVILLPRNKRQQEWIENHWPKWFENRKSIIPESAVDGMNLIWQSDLVVSGGGTMNREAAALGVPVFSIFRGKIGAVDQHLSEQGRLVLVESQEEVTSRIRLRKRTQGSVAELTSRRTLHTIVDTIVDLAEKASEAKK